ncbi:transposase [Pseudoduganella sp. GCM10020061]|uniref:REP-associated tyrosine transposase n=1 Tax=Pseudoduganella sp. GCM10020061 TaxID=3317345 RepID=UPI003642D9EF
MARLPRLVVPGQPHHIIQRGNNRQPVFIDDEDYLRFLAWLREAGRTYKVSVHAYVLMPNHMHLLATPAEESSLAQMMQWIGRKYVPYFNQKYNRVGTLWQGRFKTSVIDSENYFLVCSRYIENNPVRAQLAATPQDYRWSSYAHHAGLRQDPAVVDHALYWALGNTPFQREAAYTSLFQAPLSHAELLNIRTSVGKGWPLGSDAYKTKLEQRAKRQVLPARRGRPPARKQDSA